ncbi:hypothetical protein CW362_35790 [Streptomyces populi]|uniref:NACHT domain-containing protein n=1 Tax=Streptomyces populi TaxID=2058924 RepID=A0A2I0SEC3_9ACTN|nr:NACHT domain-containing protein [Streptomyces populi]PKT68286.1 hypothetical protein CW362_35790 [Streptomyces populi]
MAIPEESVPLRPEQHIEELLPQVNRALQPLLRRLITEVRESPDHYDNEVVRALVLFVQEADRILGERGVLEDVLDAGPTLRPPEFNQAGWSPDTVINAGQTFFNTVRFVLEQPAHLVPVPAPPPPPGDGTEFRKAVATTLLNKLDYSQNEISWLNKAFVELTTIVEYVDRHPGTGRRRLRDRRGRTVTRPLTAVLAEPQTNLVLLQGAPGAGKSVALRHHAMTRLSGIRDGRTPDAPLPLYVNLRELKAKPDEINTHVLRQYIEEQTASRGSPDLTTYFAHFFDADIRHRRVTLLFDSFDEIPAVLGSATVDKAVQPYVNTVIELIGGGGRCIVASREYKGPRRTGSWTRLQILGMSPAQQEDFLHQAGLDRRRIDMVQPLLTDPRHGFAVELQNPLSLSLLAEYVKTRNALPDRPSALFEGYVEQRLVPALQTFSLREDVEGLQTEQRRTEDFLSAFAFRLTSSRGALSVDEQSYQKEIDDATGGDGHARDRLLGVLRESGLLTQLPDYSGKLRISFGHRRVQQYFASRYVARDPSAVPGRELATHGKWRETAVTVLQVGSPVVADPLLEELAALLVAEWSRYQEAERSGGAVPRPRSVYEAIVGGDGHEVPSAHAPFQWSPEAVHGLELLTTAYHGRVERPPEVIEEHVELLVSAAWERGSISDRKFAVDCLPLLPEESRERYIDRAFSGDSNWIRATALRDCATLAELSPAISQSIRRLLITMLSERSLTAELHAVDVDLQRLRNSDDLVRVRKVISRVPLGLAFLCVLHTLIGLVLNTTWWSLRDEVLWWWLVPFFYFWWFHSSSPLSYGSAKSRAHRLVEQVAERSLGWQMQDIETDALLGVGVMCAGMSAAGLAVWGAIEIAQGHAENGTLALVLYMPLSVLTLLWGPSALFLAYYGTSAQRLTTGRLLLAVPAAVRIERHPLRKLSGHDWLKFAILTVVRYAITAGPFILLYYLLTLAGHIGRIIYLTIAICLALLFPFISLASLAREVLGGRRVRRAAGRLLGREADFFESMLSLQSADEAAEFVQLLRGYPALAALDLNRHQIRRCIDLLQNVSKASEHADMDGLRQLIKWRGNQGLLDQLGRLDEQLRER